VLKTISIQSLDDDTSTYTCLQRESSVVTFLTKSLPPLNPLHFYDDAILHRIIHDNPESCDLIIVS
jgi:hypothetical protein